MTEMLVALVMDCSQCLRVKLPISDAGKTRNKAKCREERRKEKSDARKDGKCKLRAGETGSAKDVCLLIDSTHGGGSFFSLLLRTSVRSDKEADVIVAAEREK